MDKLLKIGLISFVALVAFVVGKNWNSFTNNKMINPGGEVVKELPLEKYSFENLAKEDAYQSTIELPEEWEDHDSYKTGVFSYQTELGRVTGQVNLPNSAIGVKLPVVVMVRGYADREVYYTGYGTKNGAAYFASHGYITLAPDFLGYGGSDEENDDNIAARVARPKTLLDLLASLSSLENVDLSRVYIWGHSNGGQISLSVAEILGMREGRGVYPDIKGITLWAPVSKSFPYSVLYYTDESDDRGKALRKAIAMFEEDYNVDDFSIERYFDKIKIPLQIHQGSADDAVPIEWSNELNTRTEELGKDVTYYTYPGADHNMRPSWSTVVARDLEFFQDNK